MYFSSPYIDMDSEFQSCEWVLFIMFLLFDFCHLHNDVDPIHCCFASFNLTIDFVNEWFMQFV